MAVSSRLGPLHNLWVAITRVALDPTSSLPRGPRSQMSPAQRIRVVARWGLAATTISAVVAVWMRWQGYSFKGVWNWIAKFAGLRT